MLGKKVRKELFDIYLQNHFWTHKIIILEKNYKFLVPINKRNNLFHFVSLTASPSPAKIYFFLESAGTMRLPGCITHFIINHVPGIKGGKISNLSFNFW